MKTLYKFIFSLGFVAFGLFGVSTLKAQDLETDSSYDYRPISTGPSGILPLKKLNVSGYYRFFGINRNLEQDFVVIPGNPYASAPAYVLGTGDVYRDPPMMLLNLSVQPTSKTFIGMDYALYHNFSGQPGNSPMNLNLGINLTGSIQTDIGKYTAHMGGINWVDVSGMVFSSFIGYQRYSIYERWPWEGNAITYDRASNYHEYGNISRDMRFGMQPFKGLLVDGQELPGNLSFRFLYGTTPAQAITTNRIPSYTLGGKVVKKFKNQSISFNLMDYKLFVDSIAIEQAGIQLHTFAYDLTYKGIVVAAEFGRGQLYSQVQKDGWGQAGRISIKTPKKLTWAPIEVEAFYLSPQFVNFYGNFLSFNTAFVSTASLNQTGSTLGGSGGISNFSGSITDVGQVSNNRKGFSVNAWFDLGKTTKLNVGNMSSMEIQSLSSNLAFGHKINALPLSRFAPFTNNIGVYNNWTSYFRGFSQTMSIIDTNEVGKPKSLLGFNMLQVQLKQKVNFPYLPFYINYVGSFGSAQNQFSVLPEFGNKAYLRTFYHELDAIFMLSKKMSFITTYGKEFIKGNNQMNRGDNADGVLGSIANDPVNQEGSLFGLGLDLSISKNTNLYIRRRWFTQTDKSFVLDQIKGTETTIELKLFF
ncbi:MAG: hypothetical protein K9H61_12805 [Bacteroidia bacterium]|nr:hypothetical protein [Bacteroidia bacterium]MCF8428156.1 hypothetical protein [Bacteroidia bacterium]MCF8447863.1 hypothetical protein [Bacteroidia bacterium]